MFDIMDDEEYWVFSSDPLPDHICSVQAFKHDSDRTEEDTEIALEMLKFASIYVSRYLPLLDFKSGDERKVLIAELPRSTPVPWPDSKSSFQLTICLN